MSKLELVCGPAHPDKNALFIEEALARLSLGRGDSFIALLPSRFAAEQLRRRLVRQSAARAVALPLVLGLDDLAARLYRLCRQRLTFQPEGALAAIVADALNQQAHPLGQANSPGLAGELTRLLGEFGAVDLPPETLEALLVDRDLGGPNAPIEILAELYRDCRQRLTRDWVDRNSILAAVAACLDATTFKRHFAQVDWLYIQGFSTFPPPLANLFEKLWPLVDHCQVVLDYQPDCPQLFAGTTALFNYIKAQATSVSTPSLPANCPGVLVAEYLAAHPPKKVTDPTAAYTLACPDRIAEVEHIARRIRQICHRDPGALNRIGVSFARLERYLPLVGEIFPQHGIPFRLHPGKRLAQAPLVSAVLAAVEVVAERYSRAALLRLLSLPFVRLKAPGTQVPLSAGELDYSTRYLQPSEGRHGWLWTIDQHLDRLERDIERLEAGLAPSDEAIDPKRLCSQLQRRHQRLQDLRLGLKQLFAALAPLEPALELAVFRQKLWTAVQHLGLLNHLAPGQLDTKQGADDGLALRRLARLLDSLVALAPALRQKRFRPGELVDLLRGASARAHYQSPATESGVENPALGGLSVP